MADVTAEVCGVCGYVHPPEGYVDVIGGPDRIKMIHDDVEGRARLAAAISELVAAVESYPYMWVWGDGHGGAVLSDLYGALLAAGFNSNETISSPRFGKSKKQLPAKLRAQVMARDGLRCVFCGSRELELLGVDHIVAEANGGAHTLDNLQTLCRSCNSKKGTK